jgi:hypothetical protein
MDAADRAAYSRLCDLAGTAGGFKTMLLPMPAVIGHLAYLHRDEEITVALDAASDNRPPLSMTV